MQILKFFTSFNFITFSQSYLCSLALHTLGSFSSCGSFVMLCPPHLWISNGNSLKNKNQVKGHVHRSHKDAVNGNESMCSQALFLQVMWTKKKIHGATLPPVSFPFWRNNHRHVFHIVSRSSLYWFVYPSVQMCICVFVCRTKLKSKTSDKSKQNSSHSLNFSKA